MLRVIALKRWLNLCEVVLLVLGLTEPAVAQSAKAPVQQAQQFKKKITKTLHLDYLLFLPKDYGQDSKKKWPLVLFLHGAGERGDSLDLVKVHGIPKIVEKQPDFPAIAISPSAPRTAGGAPNCSWTPLRVCWTK